MLDISNTASSCRNSCGACEGEKYTAFAGLRVVSRTKMLAEFKRKTTWFENAAEVFGVRRRRARIAR